MVKPGEMGQEESFWRYLIKHSRVLSSHFEQGQNLFEIGFYTLPADGKK